MIRINLLPHREAKRKQNKNAFYRLIGLAAVFAVGIGLVVYFLILGQMISNQNERNDKIKKANLVLDAQIAEVATLKDEIAALKARQQAVEDLQSDRNQPVYLLDELVKQIPEGIFLRSFNQVGQKVTLVGTAQSNERVSQLLGNLTRESQWLEKPELVEIKANTMGTGRDLKKVFDFSMKVDIKRPRDSEKKLADSKAADAGSVAPAAAGANSTSAAASGASANPAPASAASSASAAATPHSGPAASQAPGSAPKKP